MKPDQDHIQDRRRFMRGVSASSIGALTGGLLAPVIAEAASVRTVVLDAGHGGHDVGAHEGLVFEKHLNFDVCKRLEIQLHRRGFRTVMTRDRDEFIALRTRSDISNKHRSAIFVSIHFNSTWKSSVVGIETFYYSYAGYQLASKVHTAVIAKLRANNRGVKRARFSVLRHTEAPAILVEGGFLSSSEERGRMLQPWYRQALSESIAAGISSYNDALRRGTL